MRRICVIVCNSGLGHVRRVLGILKRLQGTEFQFDVFADQGKLKAYPEAKSFKNVAFYHVSGDVLSYEHDFVSRYPSAFNRAAVVWSDNLSFPLKYHPNLVLTGSFLWSDVLDVPGEEDLLTRLKPRMIGNEYFATPRLKRLTSFVPVGMYRYGTVDNLVEKSGILLSCGQTNQAKAFFKMQIPTLRKAISALPPEIELHVEPDYFLELNINSGVKLADFSEGMFNRIAAAVIRPGMGTVSDVLASGGRIFSFYEQGNFELEHNADVIERLGVGKYYKDLGQGLLDAVSFLNDSKARQEHQAAVAKMDFSGLDQTVEKLKEIFKE
jgi:hypothetical protein